MTLNDSLPTILTKPAIQMAQTNGSKTSVVWPESLQKNGRQETIEKLFRAADDPTRGGSASFTECFSATGEVVARGYDLKGHDEIFKFREGAWDPISGRRHEVRKVYLSASGDDDVMVLGRAEMRHKNGRSLTQDFVGNFIFGEDGALIQRYETWLDLKPLSELMASA
ncbi:hypothetical protein H2200_002522 [Cladophialophora chaetospira]|uniref:SnoaL-like domain-containing protein n=1 Tax=Cladophialophora chaetospira TaxID=386627 RepID=A0AA38XJ48_9EURO|nr:hypothetical protein H2200_002522 [Cladophialophora chaetospira]